MDPSEVRAVLPSSDMRVSTGERGAFVRTLHMEREMRCYPIYESELRTLKVFSGLVTGAISAVTAAFVFGLSVLWDVINTTDTRTQANGAIVVGVCIVVMIAGIVAARWAHNTRERDLQEITRTTRVISS